MKSYKGIFDTIHKEVSRVIIGQEEVMEQILITLMCDGHALLEGYPGLAKTMAVRTLSQIMDLKFSRIQSTPDLMPSDVTGTYIIEEHSGKRVFKFHPGPVFANMVLADEINRATPRTQSALLEAMQERQVTVGNQTFALDPPFFVLATQNPIEQEGTYPLPEAQADRFLLKINVVYPSYQEELKIVDKYAFQIRKPRLKVVLNKQKLFALQDLTRHVPVAKDIKEAAIKLVTSTRERKDILEYGASPRASIGIVLASKARALINGRKFVSVEDVKAMAYPILRHRVILSFEAERKGMKVDDAITKVLAEMK
jgi:MoxR-like ATPase